MDQIQLRRNSAYHKMGAKTDINIERNNHKHSDNDEMQHSLSVVNDLPFAIMMWLKSLEVTTTDILQLSLKKVKISRI